MNNDIHPTTDPRDLFAIARHTAAGLIGSVVPAELDLPTPCGGFTVRELLDHMLMVLKRPLVLGQGRDPMEVAEGTQHVADDGWSAAWVEFGDALAEAWTDSSLLSKPVHLPWGDIDGAGALTMWMGDLTVHTWDLATALGRLSEVQFDDAVVAASLGLIKGMLPTAERGEYWAQFTASLPEEAREHFSPPFADAVPVAGDASQLDQLVAWTGRRP